MTAPRRRWFRFGLRTMLIVIGIISLLLWLAMPIWDQHEDFGGKIHGHPIWTGVHFH